MPQRPSERPVSQIPEFINKHQLIKDSSDAQRQREKMGFLNYSPLYVAPVLRSLPNEEISIVDINDQGNRAVLKRSFKSRTAGSVRVTLLKRESGSWREIDLLSRRGDDFWTDPHLQVEAAALSADGKFLVYTFFNSHGLFGMSWDMALSVMDTDTLESLRLKNFRAGELPADLIEGTVAKSSWFRENYPNETYDEVFHRSSQRCLASDNLRASVEKHRELVVRKAGVPTLVFPLRILPGVTVLDWEAGWSRFNSADCWMGLIAVRSAPTEMRAQTYLMEFGYKR